MAPENIYKSNDRNCGHLYSLDTFGPTRPGFSTVRERTDIRDHRVTLLCGLVRCRSSLLWMGLKLWRHFSTLWRNNQYSNGYTKGLKGGPFAL